jgi:hydroxymethylpyrimidine pyrophosphatase-like HAD family hydrolase
MLSTIRDLGIALEIIFNKCAVMVLPAGVTKASGLRGALGQLGLSPLTCIGVSDADNDLAFLDVSGCRSRSQMPSRRSSSALPS